MSPARLGLLAAFFTVTAPDHPAMAAKLFDRGPVCTTPEDVEPAAAAWSAGDITALERFDCIAFTEFGVRLQSLICGRPGPAIARETWTAFYDAALFDPALPERLCRFEIIMFGRTIRLYTSFDNILWTGETKRPRPGEHEINPAIGLALAHTLTMMFFIEPADLSLEIPPRRIVQTRLSGLSPVCTTPEAVEPADQAKAQQDWPEVWRLDCVEPADKDLEFRVFRCGSSARTPRHTLWMSLYYPVEFDRTLLQDVCEIEAPLPSLEGTKLYTDFTNIQWHD